MQIKEKLGLDGLYITNCLDREHSDYLVKMDDGLHKTEMIHFYSSRFVATLENDLNNYLNITIRNAMLEYFKEFGGSLEDHLASNSYRIATWKLDLPLYPHVDGERNNDYAQAATPRPQVTVLIYLTDNYEGGEILFPTLDMSIKPEAGSMIIFDSMLEHAVNAVKSGTRKTLSANLYSVYSPDIEEFKSLGYRIP